MTNKPIRHEILIVDDAIVNLQLLDVFLTSHGYKVRLALNGEIALKSVRSNRPDLILLDIMMPVMDGFEVCKRLQSDESTASIPIIFISAIDDTQDIVKAFTSGGVDYITKPFANEEVLARVNTHLQLSDYKYKLEERVREEVQKNDDANQLMIYQSRMAQMGEMLSMIAHQWRQPLSAISVTSMNLKVSLALGTSTEESISNNFTNIENLLEHLSNTIEDFRKFFSDEKKKETIAIDDIIQKSVNIISASLKKKNIEITAEGPKEHKITSYINEIKQVVINILKNAEDALVEREIDAPKISISWKREGNFYLISFHDNAHGIKKNILPRIFEAYFSTKDQKNGTGIGLYMSYLIITKHCQGEIFAKNEDNGVTFTIKVPVSI